MDNNEFIRELNDLIYKNTDHLNPFDIIICTFSTLACFIERQAQHKEAAYMTVELYKECLDKAYSIPDVLESN